jgi:hypothetical protein
MLNPVLFLVLLLLALVLVIATGRIRRERSHIVATAGVALILLLLLAARFTALPLSSPGFPWSWLLAETSWWSALALSLLALVGLLIAGPGATDFRQHALLLLLLAAGLAATWANSPATQVATWTLLALLVWLLVRASARPERGALPWLLGLAPLALWLAAAAFPAVATVPEMETWRGPVLTETLWLLGVFVALGAFPFHLWRPRPEQQHAAIVAMANSAPAAAGVALLAGLAGGEAIASYALPLTLAGLLGLLWAAYLAWSRSVAPALILAEAGLVLLLGAWGTPEAVLAEGRVLILAGGALLLAPRLPDEGPWRQIARAPALAALAAVPLTAGFTGRGLLYTTWLENDRWLLIVVAVLTQIPVLAAGLTRVWPRSRPAGRPKVSELALMLPLLGLISWQQMEEIAPLVWGAIALQIVGALALFRFASEAGELQQALRQAVAVRLEKWPDLAPLRAAGRQAGNALREATMLLEGEGGLLWIVLFLVIVWLAR